MYNILTQCTTKNGIRTKCHSPQDKMPQCQKRTKCHNVNGVIRIHQKCYKDVTKVLQGCNKV